VASQPTSVGELPTDGWSRLPSHRHGYNRAGPDAESDDLPRRATTAARAAKRSCSPPAGPVDERLLTDPDLEVRKSAAGLLAAMVPQPRTEQALAAALDREPDRITRTVLLVALGPAGAGCDTSAVLERYLDDPSPPIRLSAAIALVRRHGAAAGARALAVLDEGRRQPDHLEGRLPWDRGGLPRLADDLLDAV
jgi:HEAT repeat protein